MKELEIKLNELNEKLGRLNSSMENVKSHIDFLKSQKLGYLDWEILYREYKTKKQTLLIEIDTLNKAQNILLGIER